LKTINLNDHVTITLTEFGVAVYNDYLSDANLPASYCHPGDSLTLPLWELASIFGKVMFNGCTQHPFTSYTLEYRAMG
jgi:hypothetical protein